ncbi:phosphomannomutase D1 [Canna indica]|uniref:Phosphomannomutase D1 n=1 Tax=Canna indica TaxID=4628 RepID=A0AAQ3KBV6_9LILI|nr:phosphomannomutase D1 [Canna indica]
MGCHVGRLSPARLLFSCGGVESPTPAAVAFLPSPFSSKARSSFTWISCLSSTISHYFLVSRFESIPIPFSWNPLPDLSGTIFAVRAHLRSLGEIRRMAAWKPGVIALFDVDGTLTAPRKVITPEMFKFMRELREVVTVCVVGCSDLVKIAEQLGKSGIKFKLSISPIFYRQREFRNPFILTDFQIGCNQFLVFFYRKQS